MAPPSVVWIYFTKVANSKKVRCSKCQAELNYCNSTSSLQKHLEKIHQVEIRSNKRKRSSNENNAPMENDMDSTSRGVNTSSGFTEEFAKQSEYSKSNERGTLDACLEKATSFSRSKFESEDGGRRREEANNALLYMIAVDNEPLARTERKGFRHLLKTLQPLYKPPSEKSVTIMMEEKYKVLQGKVKELLATKRNFVLTTDLWTECMTTKSYLVLTVHYLDGIEMKSVVIGAIPMSERKTIVNLSSFLTELCLKWGIALENVKAVLTDNGSNVVGTCKNIFGAEKHIACFAHNLNIVAMNALRLNNSSSNVSMWRSPTQCNKFNQ